MSILINDVFEPLDPDCGFSSPQRVLWLDRSIDHIALFGLQNPSLEPRVYSYELLQELLTANQLRKTIFRLPWFMLLAENEIEEIYKTKRNDAWSLIEPIVTGDNKTAIFDGPARSILVAQQAKLNRKHRKAIHRVLQRYWKYGQTINALLPHYPNSGAKGKTRVPANRKRGRPPQIVVVGHDITKIGVNVTERDRQFFKAGIRLFYAKYSERPLTKTYDDIVDRFYSDHWEVINGVMTPIPMLPEEIPTLGQFKYWYGKDQDELAVMRKRMGERRWNKDHRALDGTAQQGLFGPTDTFEVDATIADVYLVSRYNRNWIIGRPVIYVVIDVSTHMFAGLYIGLEGPSWTGARLALCNAFMDKVSFCAEFGITISEDDWPCHYLPHKLAADRGSEWMGNASKGIVNGLQVILCNPPPYRPDWKPVVENSFNLLNQSTIHWLPGAVRIREQERGGRDYFWDAKLDIYEFTKIIINEIIHHNKWAERPRLLTQDMIANDVSPLPIEMWKWGLDNCAGSPVQRTSDEVFAHLLPKDSATVQADGIKFNKSLYTCDRARRENWFVRARNRGTWRIEISHDPTWSDYIFILDKITGEFERCELKSSEERFRNRRHEEIIDWMEYEKIMSTERKQNVRRSKAELSAAKNTITENAKTEAKEIIESVSKNEKRKNVRDNREFEKRANQVRLRDKLMSDNSLSISSKQKIQDTAEDEHTSNVVSLLRRKKLDRGSDT